MNAGKYYFVFPFMGQFHVCFVKSKNAYSINLVIVGTYDNQQDAQEATDKLNNP